ncbi:hypothetical protein OWV82_011922 [Melia azedarach]|uniref:Uncharacterized protein n=1 Tax=Melia azedarach TaxID=155640 RepID=A0ACC1Y1B5_MELAZ|nr:hypothetical protein OWV82_011922 [Melia azedarach]
MMSFSVSELEIEAAAWQLIQLRRDLHKIHHKNNELSSSAVVDEYYKPSDEVLSTAIDEEEEEEDDEYGQLMMKTSRKRKFRTVTSIYSLTKPLMMASINAKSKKKRCLYVAEQIN